MFQVSDLLFLFHWFSLELILIYILGSGINIYCKADHSNIPTYTDCCNYL